MGADQWLTKIPCPPTYMSPKTSPSSGALCGERLRLSILVSNMALALLQEFLLATSSAPPSAWGAYCHHSNSISNSCFHYGKETDAEQCAAKRLWETFFLSESGNNLSSYTTEDVFLTHFWRRSVYFLQKERIRCNRWLSCPIPVWISINSISSWEIMGLLIENYNIILARVGLCFNLNLQNTD